MDPGTWTLMAAVGLGTLGAGSWFSYRYMDGGTSDTSKHLLVLDDVLLDITIALMETPKGQDIPIDMFIGRPVNQQGKHIKITKADGGTNMGIVKSANMRSLLKLQEVPENTGFAPNPAARRPLPLFYLSFYTLVAKIQNGMSKTMFAKMFQGACKLPGLESFGSTGAKDAVVSSLLQNVSLIYVKNLDSSKTEAKISVELLMELTRSIKALMYISACFFHNSTDPASYLRQPFKKLNNSKSTSTVGRYAKTKSRRLYHVYRRDREHPFHLPNRLHVSFQRVLLSRSLGANANTVKAMKSRCFPQMLELFKLSMDYVLAIAEKIAMEKKESEKVTKIQAARSLTSSFRSNKRPDASLTELGRTFVESVRDVEQAYGEMRANTISGVKDRIEKRMADIAGDIQTLMDKEEPFISFTLGSKTINKNSTIKMNGNTTDAAGTPEAGNVVTLNVGKNVPNDIVYSSINEEGKGRVRVKVKSPKDGGETEDQLRVLTVSLLNKAKMNQIKKNRGTAKVVTEEPVPEPLLDFVERNDESFDCRVLQLILEETFNNSRNKEMSQEFLRCFSTGENKQTIRQMILQILPRYVMILKDYNKVKQIHLKRFATGGPTLLALQKDIFDEKMKVLEMAFQFARPMLKLLSNTDCYLAQKDRNDIKKLIIEAFQHEVYRNFDQEGLSLEKNVKQLAQNRTVLKKNNMNMLMKNMKLSNAVQSSFDKVFQISALREDALSSKYTPLMERDYMTRLDAGFIEYTGYGNDGNPLNTFVYMSHMNIVATLCRFINQSEGFKMYVKVGEQKANKNVNVTKSNGTAESESIQAPKKTIYNACHENYDKTLAEFYSKRKELAATTDPVKKSNTPEKTSKQRTWWERTMQFFYEALKVAGRGSVASFLMSPTWGKATLAAGSVMLEGINLVNRYFNTADLKRAIQAAAAVATATIDDPTYVFKNIPDNFQDMVSGKLDRKDLQRSSFEGFKLSSASKNNAMRLQQELLGVYTNRLRPDIFIKKDEKVASISTTGEPKFLHGICYASGWHVPVLICRTHVEELQKEMDKFQNDYIMYLPES